MTNKDLKTQFNSTFEIGIKKFAQNKKTITKSNKNNDFIKSNIQNILKESKDSFIDYDFENNQVYLMASLLDNQSCLKKIQKLSKILDFEFQLLNESDPYLKFVIERDQK